MAHRESDNEGTGEKCMDQGYLEEKDLGKLKGIADFILMDRTNFAIFSSQDAHMPQISCSDQRERAIKIVFKVPVQY